MARRPAKRKPRKSKFDKPVKSALKYKPAPLNPKFKLEVGSEHDPFHVNPATIPHGVALQWISLNVDDLERAQYSGWKPVEGQDGVKGNMLVWAPIEVAKAQTDANIKSAKDLKAEMDKLFGRKERRGVPFVSPSFMGSWDYQRIPPDAKPIDVDITIKLRVSAKWQEAAAFLALDPQEYARRRLLMERVILGPISDYCVDGIYEPVELSFTRKD